MLFCSVLFFPFFFIIFLFCFLFIFLLMSFFPLLISSCDTPSSLSFSLSLRPSLAKSQMSALRIIENSSCIWQLSLHSHMNSNNFSETRMHSDYASIQGASADERDGGLFSVLCHKLLIPYRKHLAIEISLHSSTYSHQLFLDYMKLVLNLLHLVDSRSKKKGVCLKKKWKCDRGRVGLYYAAVQYASHIAALHSGLSHWEMAWWQFL